MLQPRAIAKFAILATAFYAALTFSPRLWPSLQQGYASVFRFGGNAFFSQFWLWPEAHVAFLDLYSDDLIGDINASIPGAMPDGFTPPPPRADQDTLMVLVNQRVPGSIGMLRTSSSFMGYVPVAMVIALVLATPMRWSRKGWAVIWGLLLVQAFIAVRVSVLLLHHGFAASEKQYVLFRPGPFMTGLLGRVNEVLADNPTFAYIGPPVGVWLIILFGFGMLDRRRTAKANPAHARRTSP